MALELKLSAASKLIVESRAVPAAAA